MINLCRGHMVITGYYIYDNLNIHGVHGPISFLCLYTWPAILISPSPHPHLRLMKRCHEMKVPEEIQMAHFPIKPIIVVPVRG